MDEENTLAAEEVEGQQETATVEAETKPKKQEEEEKEILRPPETVTEIFFGKLALLK